MSRCAYVLRVSFTGTKGAKPNSRKTTPHHNPTPPQLYTWHNAVRQVILATANPDSSRQRKMFLVIYSLCFFKGAKSCNLLQLITSLINKLIFCIEEKFIFVCHLNYLERKLESDKNSQHLTLRRKERVSI